MPCVRGVCISFEGQIKNLDGDDRPEAVRLREEMRSNRFHSIIRAATSPFQAGARTDGEPVDTKITAPGEVIRLIPSTFPPLSPLQEILCQWFPRFLRRPHASVVFLRHPMTRKSRAGGDEMSGSTQRHGPLLVLGFCQNQFVSGYPGADRHRRKCSILLMVDRTVIRWV
jgi:hypothetical protein